MADKKSTAELLNDLYKNAHIALQSISNILPESEEKGNEIKQELLDEYEVYEKYLSDLAAFMKDKNIERNDINVLKKALMWSSIKMNTLADKSDNHIADMMIQGTIMGITDLRTMLSDENIGELDEDVKKFAKQLLTIEEKFEENLKKYL